MAHVMLERLFGMKGDRPPRQDPGEELYSTIDKETARDYDAGLVEFGLMKEERFNSLYPDRPFIPETVGTVAPEKEAELPPNFGVDAS
jgi:hypothetical protein